MEAAICVVYQRLAEDTYLGQEAEPEQTSETTQVAAGTKSRRRDSSRQEALSMAMMDNR